MNLNGQQVLQLKKVLKVASAPLVYKDFNQFASSLLTPLMDLLRGSGANLYITDLALEQDPYFLWHTYDNKLIPDYQAHFFKLSPVRVSVGSGMRVGAISRYVDYGAFTRTSFYNDFLRPRRIHHMAAMVAPLPERSQVGVLGVHREKAQPDFSSEDVEVLDVLFASVQGALRTLQIAGSGKEQIERTLGALPVGVEVFDWDLTRVYRNRTLSQWLDRAPLTPGEEERVRQAARVVRDLFTSREDVTPSARGVARLTRAAGSLSVRASLLPQGLIGPRPHILCTFEREAPPRSRGEPEPWIERGLTAREAEVVLRCIKGETNVQIACALHMSPETVKHHLKHVFEKLGIERRAQLIHAISLQ